MLLNAWVLWQARLNITDCVLIKDGDTFIRTHRLV